MCVLLVPVDTALEPTPGTELRVPSTLTSEEDLLDPEPGPGPDRGGQWRNCLELYLRAHRTLTSHTGDITHT